jgi:uncharacterized OB-fold protein
MQILSYILTGISIALIILMFVTYRKIRNVSIKTPLIAIAIGLAAFIIYKAIIGTSLTNQALLALAGFGALLGMWQGRKTKVWLENGHRKMQNTVWFIIIWVLGYGLSQALVLAGQAMSMNLGIGALSLSTGITLGTQSVLFLKVSTAKPRQGTTCPKCGNLNQPEIEFCGKCGNRLKTVAKVQSNTPIAAKACPKCGADNPPTDSYCSRCGQPLKTVSAMQQTAAAPMIKEPPHKSSGAWWIFAFLPVLGILVSLALLKKKDPAMANQIFIVNFTITMLILFNVYQMLI